MLTEKCRVAVILPCYGNAGATRKCLESLRREGTPGARVLAVENGTTENRVELGTDFPEVRFLSLQANLGFSGAVNEGILLSRRAWDPEYFFILNNDAIVLPGAIGRLADFLDRHPEAGLAGPKIFLDESRARLWAAGGEFLRGRFLPRNRGLGQGDGPEFQEVRECPFLPGCALLLRREAADRCGPWDEGFFIYAEDADYALRARRLGWKLFFIPDSQIIHPGSLTAGGQYEPFQTFYRWRNRLFLVAKHAGFVHKLAWGALFLPALIARDHFTYWRLGKTASLRDGWRGLGDAAGMILRGKNPEPLRGGSPPPSRLQRGYLLSNSFLALALAGMDFLGSFLFFWRPKKSLPLSVRKILVAKVDHLGDVLMALEILPSLRSLYPEAKVHFLCGPWAGALVEKNPDIEKIWTFRHALLNRKGSRTERFRAMLADLARLLPSLRRESYDLALDWRAYFPNFIPFLSLCKVRFRAGFSTAGFGFLLHARAHWREGIHETEHLMEVLRAFRPDAERREADLSYLADEPEARALLERNGIREGEPFAVVHPFCQNSFLRDFKHWKAESWIELIRALDARGIRLLCSGDADDAPLIDGVIQNTRALNAAGKLSLGALAALIRRARFVASVDTFASHLAGGLGARTLVLFNHLEPVDQWRPWGKSVRVLPIESTFAEALKSLEPWLQTQEVPA